MSTVSIPADPDTVQLVRALKGAPISCLFGMYLCYPQPVGREQLMLITGYKKDEVTDAMKLLINVYYLAAEVKRYFGWVITTKGKQLVLPLFFALTDKGTPRAAVEGDFPALDSSSSRSLLSSTDLLNSITTPTPESEGENIALVKINPLPEQLEDLISNLMLGCPRSYAESAMRDALAGGWSVDQVECELLCWVLYCESPFGRNIDLPPARFAAAKIKKCEPTDYFFDRYDTRDMKTGSSWEHWEYRNAARISRAKKLLKQVYG